MGGALFLCFPEKIENRHYIVSDREKSLKLGTETSQILARKAR